MLQQGYKDATTVLLQCYNSVTTMLQQCYTTMINNDDKTKSRDPGWNVQSHIFIDDISAENG